MVKLKIHLVAVAVNFVSFSLFGQDTLLTVYPAFIAGVYTYKPVETKESNPLLIPDVSIVKNTFYTEWRYNYDYISTSAIYAGKIIPLSKKPQQILTPQIGLLNGDYKGVSLQFYYQYIGSEVEINFQNQYGIAFNKLSNFYFNWSDVQLHITKKIRLGNSIQIHSDKASTTLDYGLFLVYKPENWTLALYSFDFYNLARHFFALEIQRAMIFKINRKHKL
jgi:hypothetical protein